MKMISRWLFSIALLSGSTVALAQTYTPLFTYPETDNNSTGIVRQSVLSQGRDGNLYSTIQTNGAQNEGTVYKITTTGAYAAVYSFCTEGGSCATSGGIPDGGVVLGNDGNLWGTTQNGGKDAAGTVFKVTPKGVHTLVYSFTNSTDDSAPSYAVIAGQDGAMYGISEAQYNGQYGSFFKLTTKGVITPHPFNYTDGASPNLPVQGSDGNFYGTTYVGGDPTCKCGVIYKATPAGKITVLHTFTGFTKTSAYDGELPMGTLVEGRDGNFYGTTYEGGTNGTDNGGIVFKITPKGVYTVIHDFQAASPTFDGQTPQSGLTLGPDGNLYGTTSRGGAKGYGALYEITPAGAEKVLYSFCTTNCLNGFSPLTAMVLHTNGKFYGSVSGNSNGGSVFYSLDVGFGPFARLHTWLAETGATAQILGQGLTSDSTVTFSGGVTGKVDSASGGFLTVTVPDGALSGPITVSTASGSVNSDRDFLVKPQLTNFSPSTAVVGATITIAGVSLSQATGVTIGGKAAAFTPVSDTEITATVGVGAKTGEAIIVTTPGGIATSTAKLVVQPLLSSFSPKTGKVGATVNIAGHSFTGATAVTFGEIAATFTVVNDVKVTATIPAGAISGPIAIATPSGVGASTSNFTIN